MLGRGNRAEWGREEGNEGKEEDGRIPHPPPSLPLFPPIFSQLLCSNLFCLSPLPPFPLWVPFRRGDRKLVAVAVFALGLIPDEGHAAAAYSMLHSLSLLLSVSRSAVKVNDRDHAATRQERPNFISGRPSCPLCPYSPSLSLPFVSRGAYPIPSANLMLGFLRKIGDIQGLFMRRAVARAVVRPTNFIRVQMACYASTATAAAAAAAVLGVLGYLGLSSPRLGYDRPRRPCDHHRKACCLEFCTRSLCGITGELYNEI